MGIPLRLLILEDNPSDAELAMHALRRAGYDPVGPCVETEQEFLDNLQPAPEVILADFTMPQFDSLRALELMQERQLDIPFIIVSGTIGEERAVQVMQRGAADYIIKDRLGRLGQAVTQALARWRLKEEKQKADQTITRLAAIVETSGDAIITKTLDGVLTSWNRAAESLYGYSAQEILGKHESTLFPDGRRQGDAPEDPLENMRRVSDGQQIAAFETVRVCKDGRRIEVLLSISPIRDRNNSVTGASAIALDITLRKRAERFMMAEQAVTGILAAAKNLEEAGPQLLQTLAECLRWEVAVLWAVDRRANVLQRLHLWHAAWADPIFIEALSRPGSVEPGVGVAGRSWSTGEASWEPGILVHGRPRKGAAPTGDGLRGGFGLPMRHGAANIGVIEFYDPELREPDKALVAALDNIACQVTQFCERRNTEAALRASEEQFRQLADAMPQIVWTARPDGTVDYCNDRWYQFAACARAVDPEQTWRSVIHPDDLQRSEEVWSQAVRSGAPLEIEIRLVEGKTGRPRWFLIRAIAATDPAGTINRWHGTATDIDDQRRGLDLLRISEERFRTLVMSLPVAVYTTDHAGRITLCNERAVELWKRRPELGKDRWCGSRQLFRPDGTALPLDQCPLALRLRECQDVGDAEIVIERPDGTRAHVLEHPKLLRGPSGEIVGAINVLLDLTQMKELEAQFRQSQKMEAVGQLAAGVAHDFNNLLTIILGFSELVLVNLPIADPGREPVEQIRNAGERAAGLTRQLLAFGRKQVLSPAVLNLNFLLTEVEKMLRRLIGADIELVTNLQPALGQVKIDSGQIEQLIMNLVVNARDAMPTGGRLTIQTSDVVLSALQLRQNPGLPAGSYVMLAVSDTGSGMDAATQARIFEPFFTTKEIGKGTGLGLATVFGVVKQSGGFIEVESAIGSGATFRMYFPQICEAEQTKGVDRANVKMPTGAETILLVEDEAGLRKLVRLVLETSGYNVLSAENGDEAVRICNEHLDKIHLLLTDVVMPKMSGRQLTDLVMPSHPRMKVLYMSGYTDDTIVRHGLHGERTDFLAKPFTPVALTQKVREVLDGPSTPHATERRLSAHACVS